MIGQDVSPQPALIPYTNWAELDTSSKPLGQNDHPPERMVRIPNINRGCEKCVGELWKTFANFVLSTFLVWEAFIMIPLIPRSRCLPLFLRQRLTATAQKWRQLFELPRRNYIYWGNLI